MSISVCVCDLLITQEKATMVEFDDATTTITSIDQHDVNDIIVSWAMKDE